MQTKTLALCAFSLHLLLACGGAVSGTTDGSAADAGDAAAIISGPADAGDSGAETIAPAQKIAIKFVLIKSASSADSRAWINYGSNLDGLVTTKDSQDVCKRASGAPSTNQEDGTDGIDISWGRNVMPVFYTLGPIADTAGYLVADESGTGVLRLVGKGALEGALLEVPVVHAKIDMNGTTAKLSALVPVQVFIGSFNRYAGRLSSSLCGGSTIASILDQFTQSADSLSTGLQSASVTCDAISLGAELTGVANEPNQPIAGGVDPCGNR